VRIYEDLRIVQSRLAVLQAVAVVLVASLVVQFWTLQVIRARHFRELAAAVATLPARTLILDGEITVFDTALLSRFEWLRERPKDETATPPMLIAFDCLYARRTDFREQALRARRRILEEEIDGHRLILPARRLAEEGLTAWTEVLARGYEGMVAKDPASPYRGGRTLAWLKVKVPHYREGERGWEPGG